MKWNDFSTEAKDMFNDFSFWDRQKLLNCMTEEWTMHHLVLGWIKQDYITADVVIDPSLKYLLSRCKGSLDPFLTLP